MEIEVNIFASKEVRISIMVTPTYYTAFLSIPEFQHLVDQVNDVAHQLDERSANPEPR